MNEELEQRIHQLENSLDHFSGVEWIVMIGEIARIREAILNVGAESTRTWAQRVARDQLDRLDSDLERLNDPGTSKPERRRAFVNANSLLHNLFASEAEAERSAV